MTRPPTDPGDLDLRWQSLGRPTGDRLTTERVGNWAGGPVVVAVDAEAFRHLLVRIDTHHRVRLPHPVSGLDFRVRELHPTGQPDATWIDLTAADPAGNRPFAGLCADIVTELPSTGPADSAVLLAVVDRWRRFWAGSREGLTRDEQLGLIGELWLLLEWLPRLTLAAVTAWQGPLRGRHDFVTDEVSVEVKTTGTSSGPVVHRINHLEQLDDSGDGQLYLLSLRAVADPLGPHSLDTLLERARQAAAAEGTTCSALLDDRLRALGITTTDRGRYTQPLRVAQQELFRVDQDFPRLVPTSFPAGLPAGVVDVSYALDTSACHAWLISSDSHSDARSLGGLL